MDRNIPGIDIEQAIQHTGSEEVFYELLRDLYHLMDEKIALVESSLLQGDIPNYTVYVHSLKTTCRMIGAVELGEQFYSLEMLGKANRIVQIKERTPEILDAFRSLKPYLMPFASDHSDTGKHFDRKSFSAILHNLSDAIADFDLITAENATRELSSFSLEPSLTEKIKELQRLVSNIDYEDANALILQILQSL